MSNQREMSRRDFLSRSAKLALLAFVNAPIFGSIGRDHPESVGAYSPVQTVRREPQLVVPLKFADIDEEPVTKKSLENLYRQNGFLDNYFKKISYNGQSGRGITIEGSQVLDWARLPHPRDYYSSETQVLRLKDGLVGIEGFDVAKTQLSSAELRLFKGVHFVLNDFNFWPVGGKYWVFKLDEEEITYGAAILGSPGSIEQMSTIIHEMGHEMADLRHHDDPWDPMYTPGQITSCPIEHDDCDPSGFNAYNLWKLGVLEEKDIYRAGSGRHEVILSALTDMPDDESKKMVYITNTVGPDMLVEVRSAKGFDVNLPINGYAESVVLVYKVSSLGEIPLLLVDRDRNGNSNDTGPVWLEGEKFIGERWDPEWEGINFTIDRLKKGRAELKFNISSRATVSGPTPTPFPTLDPKETRRIFLPVTLRNSLVPFKSINDILWKRKFVR